ncbi:MAG TPA: redoxin domain-containing protein, partial [Longimicrobiales bacterium]|nr:redoxin domain-containing protein [Longimicrobiales bacterium]
MSRRATLAALAVLILAAAVPIAVLDTAPRVSADEPGAFGFAPGELVSDFRWKAVDGRRGRLSAMLRENRAVVVVMRTVECPVSQRYGHRLAALEEAYAGQGVAFLYLDVSPQDTEEMIHADAGKFGFAGPYVADPEGKIGTLLQAKVSTEVFVIDAAGTLRYRGAVDDQFGITFSNPVMREDWLRAALDDVLAGRPVRVSETEASGCYL